MKDNVKPDHFGNILVVRTDRIGDVILTTPALSALKKAYPKARLSMMVVPGTRELVEGIDALNEVIVYDRRGEHKGIFGFWKFIGFLRKKNFDLAVVFHTKKRTNLICFLAGIPRRIGYRNNKFGFLLTDQLVDTRIRGEKHEAEYCFDVLRTIGIASGDLQLSLPLREESERWVDRFVLENKIAVSAPLVAVHPDASCISKRWPVNKFSELIQRLMSGHGINVILIGDHGSQRIAAQLMSDFKGGGVVNAAGLTSVGQLASLLKRCKLLISNDSGPVHVACAVGTPVISIFGRNQAGLSPVRWRPLGLKDQVFHKEVGCAVCLAHKCDINFKCLEAINVDEVFQAAVEMLQIVKSS